MPQSQSSRSKSTTVETKARSAKGSSVASEVQENLNELLANEYLLFTKTLNYHWNVIGDRFYSVHVFLENQYKELLELMDDLAERIRYLDGRPLGTLKEMRSEGSLTEDPGHIPDINTMLKELAEGHEAINAQAQKILDEQDDYFEEDRATEDLLISFQRKHQKMIWMLRSHLQEGVETSTPPSRHN